MKRRMRRMACFLMAAFMLCSGLDLTVFAASANSVKSVALKVGKKNYTKKTYQMKAGKKITVKAVCKPTAAVKSVSYKSSNKTVATVTKKGVVKAVKPGTAKITATVKGKNKKPKKAYMKVKVAKEAPQAVNVSSVVLDKTELSLSAGESAQLTAKVLPNNAKDKTVRFSSSNSAVATVSPAGLVTAASEGTAKITAAAGGKTAVCSVKVTVQEVPVTGIKLNMASITLNKGHEAELVSTVLPRTATNQEVSYSSSDDKIVFVDDRGLMTAIANGTAKITVTCGEITADCQVKVVTEASSVMLNASNISIYPKENVRLKASVFPEDAWNNEVIFISSNEEVATVTNSGEVQAHKTGLAIVTVKTKNGGFEASCEVHVKPQTSEIRITSIEGDAVYNEQEKTYDLFAGQQQEITAESDIGAEVSFRSSDNSVLTVEQIHEGSVYVKSVKTGIASVIVSSLGDHSSVTKRIWFHVKKDMILVSNPAPIFKKGDIYEFTVSLRKGSEHEIEEEELKGSVINLKSKEYSFDAEYVEGSYDSIEGTASYRIGSVGHVILESGNGALTYQLASFAGGLADGSAEGQELKTSYAELVEGIRITSLEQVEGIYSQELYVGQEISIEAEPINGSATVKELDFAVTAQEPEAESGKVVSITPQDHHKLTISAVGAGTAEIEVSAKDMSEITEKIYVTVRQETVLAESKPGGRLVKHVNTDGSFYFTAALDVSLESGHEIDASESSSIRAMSLLIRKRGEETREAPLRFEQCVPAEDRRFAKLTFSTVTYPAGTDEGSSKDPCPLITKNNAATGDYYLISPSAVSMRFIGYPNEEGEEYPTVSYRETATSQSIEGYVVNKKGERLPGIQISVGSSYHAVTDRDGYYFIDLGTSRASEVTASDPEGTYWNAVYSGAMDVSAGKKVAVNFTMSEQDLDTLYLYGYVKGKMDGTVSALGGAVVELQCKSDDSDWTTIAQVISSDASETKGKYVFANAAAVVDEYKGQEELPQHIHRFETGDENYLSNDKSNSYRVVVKKPVTLNNLTDVYGESVSEGKALSERQADTSLGDLILEKVPETYTNINQANRKEFCCLLSWDNQNYISTGSGTANKTAAANVTGTAAGLGTAKYKLSLLAPDGVTVLKMAEFTDTLVDDSSGTVKISKMENPRDLIAAGFFGEANSSPALPQGTYYFVVDDSVNAYMIVPVTVDSKGLAVLDEARCTVTIPFTKEIHTQTAIGSGTNSLKKLEMTQTSGDKLARVTDIKGTAQKTVQIEPVEYKVFQVEGDVKVYLRNSKDEAGNPSGMTVEKNAEGISASHKLTLSRLQQGTKYCMELTGDLILGELDQQTAAFKKAENNQLFFTRADATGTESSNFRVKGTANINCVEIPANAFSEISDNSISFKSVTLKKGDVTLGVYEAAEEDQTLAAGQAGFRIDIPDTETAFQCLDEGDDYSIRVEVNGYESSYEETFSLIQYGETTVTYNYEETSGQDKQNVRYQRIAKHRVSGTLTDADGNAVVDDQAGTIDAVIYLYDAQKRLCGIERMGHGDVNGDTKAFQFVDGVNAVIEEDGTYTLVARCSMLGTSKGKPFQTIKKEIQVVNGSSEDIAVKVETTNKPGATISAVILQENLTRTGGADSSSVSVLPEHAIVYAYEVSDYYLPSPLDLSEDELDESRYAEGMCDQYRELVKELDGHFAGIGRYEMHSNEHDRIYWETNAEVAMGNYAIYAQTQMFVVKQDGTTEFLDVDRTYFGEDDALGYFSVTDSIERYSYAFHIVPESTKTDFMREITVAYSFENETRDNEFYDMIVLYDAVTQLPVAYDTYCSENETENVGTRHIVTFKVYNENATYRAVVYRNGYYVGMAADPFEYQYQQTTKKPDGNIQITLEQCR